MKNGPSLKLILEVVDSALFQHLNSFDGSRLCSKPAGGCAIKILFTPKDPLGPFVVEATNISPIPKNSPIIIGVAYIYGGE